MEQFKVFYIIRFVSGNLEGLTTDAWLSYPMSSLARVEKGFRDDVASGRIIKGGGSAYVIEGYRIERGS